MIEQTKIGSAGSARGVQVNIFAVLTLLIYKF